MKKYIVFLCFIMLSITSCAIYKQEYRSYETGLPHFLDYWSISKEDYKDYFFNDLYFDLRVYPTRYYPGIILDKKSTKYFPDRMTEGAPFEVCLNCVFPKGNNPYEKIVVESIDIFSSTVEYLELRGINYFLEPATVNLSDTLQNFFRFFTDSKGNKSFYFNHEKNEIITVKMKVFIYDNRGNVFYKSLQYQLTPKIRYEYFDWLFAHM